MWGSRGQCAVINIYTFFAGCLAVNWDSWWTYDGISGPSYWGIINHEWSLCNKGRRQSPIDIEPDRLLYDPNLRLIHIDKHRLSGNLSNTGHSIIFKVDHDTVSVPVNISGGPLSYKYQFEELHIHYGKTDGVGSEHTINGISFPAEIQLFGFNNHLYSNYSEALDKAQGIVGVALLIQLGEQSNPELRIFTEQTEHIIYGGERATIKHLSLRGLLPDTDYYMTYEGSTTMPACHETVTWIVMNKPIYITRQQLHSLRKLIQGGPQAAKVPLGNNFRPPLPLHHRPVRTNIDINWELKKKASNCPSMQVEKYYKANSWEMP